MFKYIWHDPNNRWPSIPSPSKMFVCIQLFLQIVQAEQFLKHIFARCKRKIRCHT